MVVSGIYLYEARRNFEYGAGRTASGAAKDLWRSLELLLQSVQPPAPEVRVASVSDIDSLVAVPVLIAELNSVVDENEIINRTTYKYWKDGAEGGSPRMAVYRDVKPAPNPEQISRQRELCHLQSPSQLHGRQETLQLPSSLSVGPFQHRQGHLQMMEEHKYHYLKQLLERTGLTLGNLFGVLQPMEAAARECYSEEIPEYYPNHFLSVMLVDGCFIVELLGKVIGLLPFEDDDPIASMSWIRPILLRLTCAHRDLILLENQLPFFIIQKLFEHTQTDNSDSTGIGKTRPASIVELSYRFLSSAVGTGCWMDEDPPEGKVEHLLDLLRTSLLKLRRAWWSGSSISCDRTASLGCSCNLPPSSQVVPSLLKLRRAGIELSQRNKKKIRCSKEEEDTKMSFLDVKFIKRGVMELPKLTIDHFMALFLSNCLAYESCHKICSKHFTAYIVLLDCLVKSENEIRYLCNNDIIENYIGTDAELASFINILGKNVSVDVDQCYLTDLFREIKSYQRSWNVRWRTLYLRCSETSPTPISTLHGLGVLQTSYTIFTCYNI
ncbi:hypothetical protein V2J09_006583 [Rumex salicifolius]